MKTIGFKLIVAVSIATIVTFGIYTYLNIVAQRSALISEVERHINQLSETVRSGIRSDMLLNQRERIDETIGTIGRESSIHSVRIFNQTGSIAYSSKPAEIGTKVDEKSETCFGCHASAAPLEHISLDQRTRIFRPTPDSSRVLGIILPIYNETSCKEADCHAHENDRSVLGVLDVSISLHDVDRRIESSTFKAIGFAVVSVLVLGLVIILVIRRWIARPVKDLVAATNAVAVGNLDYSISTITNDELGKLATSFNNMIRRISEMRTQLFQSSKLASLGRLAAGVAHELNNPLTGVLTYSSYLLKRAEDNTEMKNDLEVIVRETKRSREIIKGLLDFARQSTPVKSQSDVNEIINRSVGVIANQLSINNIELERRIPDGLPMLIADANQIEQVLINLLVNAIDAIGTRGGKITIAVELLALSPRGSAQIRNAVCSNNHKLMDYEHRIEGQASIRVKTRFNNNEGFVHLDPVYGRSMHHYGISFVKNGTASFFCPECGVSLIEDNVRCPICASPIFAIAVPGKGKWRGCARFGCGWQKWDAVDQGGDRQFVEISIIDSGCGIAQDEIAKIFEPFYSTKGQKGTGLGLAVVWGILDAHEGKISVKSTIGNGTTFTVRLPVERPSYSDEKAL